MDKARRERLEAKGWKVGTVAEFLELTPEESTLVEIKLALGRKLRQCRQEQMTQAEQADKIHSSQPRIARAETVAARFLSSCLYVRFWPLEQRRKKLVIRFLTPQFPKSCAHWPNGRTQWRERQALQETGARCSRVWCNALLGRSVLCYLPPVRCRGAATVRRPGPADS